MRYIVLDVETSPVPIHFPWCKGFYLSLVCITRSDGIKIKYVFEHSQNKFLNWKLLGNVQHHIDWADLVIGQNIKFDVNVLRWFGLDFNNTPLYCTLVAQYLLNYQLKKSLDLDSIAETWNVPIKKNTFVKELWNDGVQTYDINLNKLTKYCFSDCRATELIYLKQHKYLKKRGLLKVFNLQMEWLFVLSEMEINGFKFDIQKAKQLAKRYTKLTDVIVSKLKPWFSIKDFNLASNEDRSVLIYGGKFKRRYKGPVIKTKNVKVRMGRVVSLKSGKRIKIRNKDHPKTKVLRYHFRNYNIKCLGLRIKPLKRTQLASSSGDLSNPYYSTDNITLKRVLQGKRKLTCDQKKVIRLLLKYAKLQKVIATLQGKQKNKGIVAKIRPDGLVHTNYNQAVTATGRLSSTDPNSQNLPRSGTSPLKKCILPTLDYIMNGDLSQIEWRTPAFLSQDSVMLHEIRQGINQHNKSCVDLMKFKLNKLNYFFAKIFNFRMIYGGTEYGFFLDPNMPNFSMAKWKSVINNFFHKYKGLYRWQEANINHVILGDGTLSLPTGREYKFSLTEKGIYPENKIKNYPVQGMAGGDILPLAACIIFKGMKKRNMKSKMILTIHDSIVFDVLTSEVHELATLVQKVFNNLDKFISKYFNINFNVPLTGEIEIGRSYGNLEKYENLKKYTSCIRLLTNVK